MKKFIALIMAAVMLFAACSCVRKSTLKEDGTKVEVEDTLGIETNSDGTKKEVKSETVFNFLVMGHDREASLTDVMMLINYDTESGKATISQLPRDTYINLENYSYHKMNGLYNYCMGLSRDEEKEDPELDGCRKAADYLAKIMGIKIHYCAVMDLDGFGSIVDSIGGVYMYVPYSMKYSDPDQGLYINLPEGYNTLDGNEAEQFVRYRSGYLNADLGRGDAQKMFMTAFIESFKKNISITNIGEIAEAVFTNVKTDMKVKDIIKFMTKAINVDLTNITMQTMPGEACGASYYVLNRECVTNIMNESYNIFKEEIEMIDPDMLLCKEGDAKMKAIYEKSAEEFSYKSYNAQDISDEDIYVPLK